MYSKELVAVYSPDDLQCSAIFDCMHIQCFKQMTKILLSLFP